MLVASSDDVQQAAGVAQVPVRDELEPVQRRLAAQHLPAQHDQPAVLEHPHLAAVLGLVRRRRLLERERRRLVDRPPAVLHHQVRQREVVPEARVDLDVVGAAHRVDRAVAAGDRAEPRLGGAHGQLVAPVDALAVRAVRALEPQPPADVRDLRVGERAHERRSASGAQVAFASEKARISPLGLAHGAVLRGDLAAARVADHAALAAAPRPAPRSRSVEASEVTTISSWSARVVEREQVRDRAARSPAPRRGRPRSRSRVGVPSSPRPAARRTRATSGGGERVRDVRPHERGERDPEEDGDDDHAACRTSRAARLGSARCAIAAVGLRLGVRSGRAGPSPPGRAPRRAARARRGEHVGPPGGMTSPQPTLPHDLRRLALGVGGDDHGPPDGEDAVEAARHDVAGEPRPSPTKWTSADESDCGSSSRGWYGRKSTFRPRAARRARRARVPRAEADDHAPRGRRGRGGTSRRGSGCRGSARGRRCPSA